VTVDEESYKVMSLIELQKHAKSRGIKTYKMKKEECWKVIRMLLNKAISGTITIHGSKNSYILRFDKTVYNLLFEFDYGPIAYSTFKVKINDGDPIKLYDIQPTKFENVEVYKIEFIKQYEITEDIDVYYQGFVKS